MLQKSTQKKTKTEQIYSVLRPLREAGVTKKEIYEAVESLFQEVDDAEN